MRMILGMALAFVAVAFGEAYVAWQAGLALPIVIPLSIVAAAATAFAILAIDTATRRFRGPTRAQIAEALALLREMIANDAATQERMAALTRTVAIVSAEPRLRALEARIVTGAAELAKFDAVTALYPPWQSDLAAWYALVESVLSLPLQSEHDIDPKAEERARKNIPFNKNLSSIELKSALSFLIRFEAFSTDRTVVSDALSSSDSKNANDIAMRSTV